MNRPPRHRPLRITAGDLAARADRRHLRDLRRRLENRAPGVLVHLSVPPGTPVLVIVHLICVPPDQRGHGLGQRVLDLICAAADEHGWTLALSPTSGFGSDEDRLTSWYTSNGFNTAPAAKQTMSRQPLTLTPRTSPV